MYKLKHSFIVAFVYFLLFLTFPGNDIIGQKESVADDYLVKLGTKKYRFRNVVLKNNKSSVSNILSINQDKFGFIWIGSSVGLDRYDGKNFISFRQSMADSTTIHGNITSLLNSLENDVLWAGSRHGLCSIDTRTLKVTRVDLGLYSDIRTMFRDGENTIWFGTQKGLVKFDEVTHDYTVYNTSNSNISDNKVRAIYKDDSGNLWAGTHDKLNVLKKGQNTFEKLELKGDYSLQIQNKLILSIKRYSERSDSLLWIGTETGLYLFNRFSYKTKVYSENKDGKVFSNNKIVDIVTVGTDELWLATDFGLNLFDVKRESSVSFYHNPYDPGTIINNKIWTIFKDNSGIIWIGTANGISVYDKQSSHFEYFPVSYIIDGQPIGIQINSIVEEDNNSFWLATQNGVVKYSTLKGITKELKHDNALPISLLASKTLKVYYDDLKRLWIATNKGLNIWDDKNEFMYSFPAVYESGSGLKSQFVNDIIRAEDGSFWLSTWDGGLHRVYGDSEDLSSISIKQILNKDASDIAGKNVMWSLTSKHLYKIGLITNEIEVIKSFDKMISDNYITSIYYSNRGTLWFGSEKGLIEFNVSNEKSVLYSQTIDNNYSIISILESNNGDIWFSSSMQVVKFDIQEQKYEVYPLGENVPVKRFRRGSCCSTSTGELVFAGDDGFIKFYPDRISKSIFVPSVFISELFIRGKRILPGDKLDGKVILTNDISFEKTIELNYLQQSVMFSFASLQYGSLKGNIFAYKLDGFDDDWIYTPGEKNFAMYSNLPSGKYLFHLKGTNNDGVWSDNESLLTIIIKPPLWASCQFLILYVLIFALIVWAIIYFYKSKQKWLNELKIISLEKEHNDKLALAKQRFFINISHEFRTPLSLIVGPANELLKKNTLDEDSFKLTQLLLKNAQRLLRLVNQILDFRKLEVDSDKLSLSKTNVLDFCKRTFDLFSAKAEEKNIEYIFKSDVNNLEVWLDYEKIETAVHNLLSNAFNFTPDNGKIEFEIKTIDDSTEQLISLKVTDSGIGIEQEELDKIFNRFYQGGSGGKMAKGSGIGLTLVKEFVEMHSGTISVSSVKGEGAVFEIILPVIIDIAAEDIQNNSLADDAPESSESKFLHVENSGSVNNSYLEKPTILIVEDEKEIIDFIKLSLKDKYDFIIAENGKVALEIIEKQSIDLIISDVMMPDVDGYELSTTVKENPKLRHIPIVLLSAKTLTNDQIMGFKSGADAYLTKPFDINYLDTIIENQLSRKESLLEYLRMQSLLNPEDIKLTSVDEKILKQVIAFIETHISDPDLNVNSICKATGYTYSFLYRKIKSLTGDTFNELIRDVRIKRAAQLLKTKKFSVAEVMMEVGFSNHSYFSKCFRKMHNTSPGNYLSN